MLLPDKIINIFSEDHTKTASEEKDDSFLQ